MSKGILELIKEQDNVPYDSSKGVTIEELCETIVKMKNAPYQKPEYILSIWEAENLPLDILNWMGENYRVLCSLQVFNIVNEREANEKSPC